MKIIDCDSHYLPPTVFDNVPEKFKHLLPTLEFDADGRLIAVENKFPDITANPRPLHSFNELGLTVITQRIEDFTKLKISKQLLAPQELAMCFNYSVEPELAAEVCHSYNIEIKKVVDAHPSKFFAAGLLPLQNMPRAVTELKWLIANGFKSIYVDMIFFNQSMQCSPVLDLPGIAEILELCEANGIVIYFHNMMHHVSPFGEAFSSIKYFLPNVVHVSIYSIIASGTFDKYPLLQVVFAEGADYFAYNIYKVCEAVYSRKGDSLNLKTHPLELFKNNISFTVDIEETEVINALLRLVGSSRLLFSTDYPHDDPSGKNQFNDTMDLLKFGLSRTDLENIAYRNAEKLFQLA